MVYDKKSGDPDFDDKVPAEQHAARVVTAGDGREVRITESTGPVDSFGAHVNLDDPKGDNTDNRPAPGGVAEEPSEVQTYDAKAAPVENLGKVDSQADLDAKDPPTQQAGQSGDEATAASKPTNRTSRTK